MGSTEVNGPTFHLKATVWTLFEVQMLPFLKKTQEAGVSAPPESIERKPDNESEIEGLESAMEELHGALSSQDFKSAAQIFKSAFELCESYPHAENMEGHS